MKNRKMTAALLLAGAALAPGFVFVGPAAAQETKEKSSHKAQTMTMDQVPQPVQQTINQEAKGGSVGSIKQETSRAGKTFYVAEVTDTGGKKHHVRVNEDGTLMSGGAKRSSKSASESTTTTK